MVKFKHTTVEEILSKVDDDKKLSQKDFEPS